MRAKGTERDSRREETRWKRVRRSNQELKKLYKKLDIIGIVKAQRIRWLGQIMKTNMDRITRRVTTNKLRHSKRRDRLRKNGKKCTKI